MSESRDEPKLPSEAHSQPADAQEAVGEGKSSSYHPAVRRLTQSEYRTARSARSHAESTREEGLAQLSVIGELRERAATSFNAMRHIESKAENEFDQANAAYKEKRYSEAAAIYRTASTKFQAMRKEQPPAPSPQRDELASARSVAKEWLAGTTALFGLFSLGGVFFARDALQGLSLGWQAAVAASAVLAVLAAASSIFLGNRAAHGWLRKSDKNERPSDAHRLRSRTEKDHYWSVVLSGIALALLVLTLVLVWFGQGTAAATPGTAVRVFLEGRSVACGSLVGVSESELTIRNADAVDKAFLLSEHDFSVESC